MWPYSNLEFIGTFATGFIITKCKTRNCLVVFDQHALHERIRLESRLWFAQEAFLLHPSGQPKEMLLDQQRIEEQACKGAITIKDQLSPSEISALISAAGKCKLAALCAHGRPSYITISLEKLSDFDVA